MVYGVKYEKNKEKKSVVYKNTAAIKYLLMYYKRLTKLIKNYINLIVPFFREAILHMYLITRI